jgi:RNA polymerase sigma factor (sigma-70 family)
MVKVITNEEFEQALKNSDNVSIMNSAVSGFRKSIDRDELYRCKLIALWETMQTWKPDGRKFTSFLYQKVRWECLKVIYHKKREKGVSLVFDVAKKDNDDISEIIEILPKEFRELVVKRFLHGMTLSEIGTYHKICTETVRRRINKALEILQKNI